MQPSLRDVTNNEFKNAIRMLTHGATNNVGQQRLGYDDVSNASRMCEFFRMNPAEFTGSNIMKDPKNFFEDLQKCLRLCLMPMQRI